MKSPAAFPNTGLPWHKLLAPLPAEATPQRKPLAPPEIIDTPVGEAISGWQQLVVELSAGEAGMRVVMVLVDVDGRVISASDMVMLRTGAGEQEGRTATQYRHESIGGRFEEDGSFKGTRWHMLSTEMADGDDVVMDESIPSEPEPQDVEALKALAKDVLMRATEGSS